MISQTPAATTLTLDFLTEQIEDVLAHLGTGGMDSVPYDTAWVARLSEYLPDAEFAAALDWVRRHQHHDGSWGADVMHYHDHVLSTLAAIIALRTAGHGTADEQRVRQGERFLWWASSHLHEDANDTVGFQVLAMTLMRQAVALGLDIPLNLSLNADVIERKIRLLSGATQSWRQSSMIFSFEAVAPYFFGVPDFLEDNGSVSGAPATTVAMILRQQSPDPRMVTYLKDTLVRQNDGGVPNLAIEAFESSWGLNYFRMVGAVTPEHPQVQRILSSLWPLWSSTNGMSCSPNFSVPDLDCTTIGLIVLNWGRYPVHADVFASYEEADHFHCYPAEQDPSLGVNLRTLAALKLIDHPQRDVWIQKIIGMLRHHEQTGQFWSDKWHASPYYLACITVQYLHEAAADLTRPRFNWITRTQQADGGWGYYGKSTPEETAYGLQVLLFWDRNVERVDPTQIQAAVRYLAAHINDEYISPLWIGKCLYTPRNVVKSIMLSTLFSYLVE